MEIYYLGHSAFKIKGKSSVVVTDPYGPECGKFPRGVEANIVTVSHDHTDHNQVQLLAGNPFVVNGPGEYEIGGISVVGVPTWHDEEQGGKRGVNTLFVVEMDGLRLAHAGDLGHKLSQEQLEEMGPVDLLMIPVGGEYTIDAKMATEVVKQVDPWVVIPMHYQQPGLDKQTFGGLTGVELFLKEMGKPDVVAVPKLAISEDRLPSELQVVVLERKS